MAAEDESKVERALGLREYVTRVSGGALRLRTPETNTASTPAHLAKGRGLVAARAIEAGTLLFTEPNILEPLIRVAPWSPPAATKTRPSCLTATTTCQDVMALLAAGGEEGKAMEDVLDFILTSFTPPFKQSIHLMKAAARDDTTRALLLELLDETFLDPKYGMFNDFMLNSATLFGGERAARMSNIASCITVDIAVDTQTNEEFSMEDFKRIAAETKSDRGLACIFPAFAMANHDCDPTVRNASYVPFAASVGDEGGVQMCMALVATRDIVPGDEVLVSYGVGSANWIVSQGLCGCDLCAKTPEGTGHRRARPESMDEAFIDAGFAADVVAARAVMEADLSTMKGLFQKRGEVRTVLLQLIDITPVWVIRETLGVFLGIVPPSCISAPSSMKEVLRDLQHIPQDVWDTFAEHDGRDSFGGRAAHFFTSALAMIKPKRT